jgi:hypothetical protein
MHELEKEQIEAARRENRTVKEVSMCFRRNVQHKEGTHGAPVAKEIAIVYTMNDENSPNWQEVSIAVHPRGYYPCHTISHLSGYADPMVYPILYPHGSLGWTPNIPHNTMHATQKHNTVTVLEHYASQLYFRSNQQFTPIMYARALFQQYLCDAAVKIEFNNLKYILDNQKQWRREHYQGLYEHYANRAVRMGVTPGNLVILPSSYSDSPRAYVQRYLDDMAMMRKFGRPDFFITFTMNANCEEVVTNLFPDQTASDRPDLVARVFALKLKRMLVLMTKERIFGKVICWTYSVEFQKRGLPHAHILITMKDEDKPRDEIVIDKLISAEFPDNDVELLKIVSSTMVHRCSIGKCLTDAKSACNKRFPKAFCESTNANVNGYPEYRRRDRNEFITRSGQVITNQFVVPYNPYLLKVFASHINFEVVTSMKSVKYVNKYIHKAPSQAAYDLITNSGGVWNSNEVIDHVEGRYMTSPEACWRIQV